MAQRVSEADFKAEVLDPPYPCSWTSTRIRACPASV